MYCAIYGNAAIAEMLLRCDDVGVNAADDEVVGLYFHSSKAIYPTFCYIKSVELRYIGPHMEASGGILFSILY